MHLPTHENKIAPGIQLLIAAASRLNARNDDLSHDIYYDLTQAEDLLLNRFQTVPADRSIHITTSFCDPDGSAYKSDDDDIGFEREISAANLYISLKAHVEYYDPEYKLNVNIQDLEDWLTEQTPFLKTVKHNDLGCIEDTGLTVADFKTDYGSIDFFIEYGISFPEEIYNGE